MNEDPKSIWQDQATETGTMTLNLIHRRVSQLRMKTRLQILAHAALCTLDIAIFLCVWKSVPRLWPFLLLAIVWSLTGLYLLSKKRDSETSLNGIDFYRNEIERRRAFLQGGVLHVVGPTLLAGGAFVFVKTGGRPNLLPNTFPFLFLLVVWAFATLFIRRKERRQLQQELMELNQGG